ncbi:MAG: winged helix-turn-helix transcriptional regulator [Anaerolineae bacterium]|nr:winged helix-turn-helix transcriptional regulator [Anaerolineae bacterium]
MNVSSSGEPAENKTARLFSLLGQPVQLKILLLIGEGEACVCHLEAALGLRQARISQHLMALRAGGWVNARRTGRHMYYSLSDLALLDLIHQAEKITGYEISPGEIPAIPGCPYLPKSSSGRSHR